jgi:hypothetical protein
MKVRTAGIFLVALLAGTGCSLLSKVLLSVKGTGSNGEEEIFAAPLVQVSMKSF